MDFLEDLLDGLTERKKHGKHKHGSYDNHYEKHYGHDEHNHSNTNTQGDFCTKCSVQNISGSKFCSNCGNPMKVETHCHNCGVKIPLNSSFCNGCGTKLK